MDIRSILYSNLLIRRQLEKDKSPDFDKIARLLAESKFIISHVPNLTERRILELHYVYGLSWNSLSNQTHYDPRWLKRLAQRGIASITLPSDFHTAQRKEDTHESE